ncbi:MAG: Asp23/Gls24 family envelope stress response protein [Candidatus Bipolaricaulota bacterium]
MAEQHVVMELALGTVSVDSDVLAATVGKALDKVEGVRPLRGGGGVIGIFGGGEESVHLETQGDMVNVELRIAVILGYPVHEVAQAVQQAVREDLEQLASARVGQLNVFVKRVISPEEELVLDGEEESDG